MERLIKLLKTFFKKYLDFKSSGGDIGLNLKPEIKMADEQNNKLIEINNDKSTTNNNSIINQDFHISILGNINYKESVLNGINVGNENANEIASIINEKIFSSMISNEEIIKKLKNPEILSTTSRANKIAYTLTDTERRRILAELVFSKLKEDKTEESNTLSIAISIIEFFTINHLKAISLLYLIFIKYIDQFLTEEKFDKFYESKLSNLLSYSTNDLVGLEMTIISQGAATMVGMRHTLPCQITINELKNKDVLNQDALDKIAICWNKFGAGSIQLTPAGECLAKRYLFDVLGISV